MPVKPTPEGYHTATAYLICRNAAAAIDFYKKAFDAVELFRMPMGDRIGHAEIKIGDSPIMLADEHPEMAAYSPAHYGGTPVSLLLYFPDVDKQWKQALAAGGKEKRPLQNQFYGDRSGTLVDPFGHVWTLATHVEDVSPAEMESRMQKMMSAG
jgi:PhnB protein